MSVPDEVREELRALLAEKAEALGWSGLTWVDKSQKYEEWTRAKEVGDVLAKYMDRGQVRVYIKDTLMKNYTRSRLADDARPLRVLGVAPEVKPSATYRQPHGRRFEDGRVIGWGRAADWKTILMALHERAYCTPKAVPYGVVLLEATGRFGQEDVREMVGDAASRLGIERIIWLEA